MKKSKIKNANLVLFLICLFSSAFLSANAQLKSPTKESIDSFYTVFESIDWDEPLKGQSNLKNGECEEELKKKIKTVPKLSLDKHFDKSYREALEFFIKIQEALDENEFKGIDIPNIPGLEAPVRDKLLSSINTDRRKKPETFEEYRDRVKGKGGTLTEKEEKALQAINQANRYATVAYSGEEFMDCETFRFIAIYVKKIDVLNKKITWGIGYRRNFKCDCEEGSTAKDLRRGVSYFTAEMESSYEGGNLFDIRFLSATKASVYDLFAWCCKEKPKEDESPKDDEDNDGSKDDHGYYNPDDTDKECCSTETGQWTVGVFPALNLGNNFEDSQIGIKAELGYHVGSIFEGNPLYVGISGMYLTNSLQGGEVKDNSVHGGVFVENWTPIAPCVKWTQGITANFGTGSVESFGTKEDFTGTKFSIDSGVVIHLNKVNLVFNSDIVSFGSYKYEFADQDFTQDLGELSVFSSYSLGLSFSF